MHQFYRLFPDALIAKQDVSQTEDLEIVFLIPWGHMVQILNKCKGDKNKALFYVGKTYDNS